PRAPAFNISLKITVVPNSTKPILTYNSVESASLNQEGNLKKLLISKPIPKLNMTASRLYSRTVLLPAIINANRVNTKMKGKTIESGFNGFPNNTAPTRAAANTNKNCAPIVNRFSGDRTSAKSTADVSQEKVGLGTTTPNSAKKMIANPRITTTQSSLIITFDLEDDIIIYS